jgi:hypothetical protein
VSKKPLSQQLREYYEKYPLDDEFVYSFADELEDQEKELNELKAWKEEAKEFVKGIAKTIRSN